ncbi:hypothetical protein J4440_03790 [Candidatus Woesearchaeota archaeon]|nr:hypothetical protein [Candidatus Woesearchaeota archaeon]
MDRLVSFEIDTNIIVDRNDVNVFYRKYSPKELKEYIGRKREFCCRIFEIPTFNREERLAEILSLGTDRTEYNLEKEIKRERFNWDSEFLKAAKSQDCIKDYYRNPLKFIKIYPIKDFWKAIFDFTKISEKTPFISIYNYNNLKPIKSKRYYIPYYYELNENKSSLIEEIIRLDNFNGNQYIKDFIGSQVNKIVLLRSC